MDQEKELGQKFTFWSLAKFVAPSIFTFVFIAVYQMADGLFIERFVGEMAISAINLYYPVISLFIAIGIMIGTGGNAVIVKKVGEGKRKEAGQTFSRIITFSVLCSLMLTAICLVFADPIMRLCGATDGNIEYLRPYYMELSTFSLAIILQSELGILIIGEGKTVVAAVVIMIGGVLNCVLDYVFMKYLGLGIRGAALATVIGYCSTILYALWFYVLARKSSYYLELAKPDVKEIGEVCFNGSSDMVSNLASGVTAVTYVQVLIMMVFMGFTSAVEPVFSFHYGTGNTDMRKLVYRLCIRWSVILGACSMALLAALRIPIIDIFFDPGTDFFDIASRGFLISLPACLFVGVNIFGSGLFTAFSNGKVSAILSVTRTFAVLTACLYTLTALFGGDGLWSAWPAAELISLIVTVFTLRRYRAKYQY